MDSIKYRRTLVRRGLALLLLCGVALAGGYPINTVVLYNNVNMGPTTNFVSRSIDLKSFSPDPYPVRNYGFQLSVTGGGGLSNLWWEGTIDGTNWVAPSTSGAITNDFLSGDGPAGDGKDIIPFSILPVRWIRFKCTVTGKSAVVSGDIVIQ